MGGPFNSYRNKASLARSSLILFRNATAETCVIRGGRAISVSSNCPSWYGNVRHSLRTTIPFTLTALSFRSSSDENEEPESEECERKEYSRRESPIGNAKKNLRRESLNE